MFFRVRVEVRVVVDAVGRDADGRPLGAMDSPSGGDVVGGDPDAGDPGGVEGVQAR